MAVVVPIPKPGKDHSDPGNFRPIALTSCLCKTIQRMINTRLTWSLVPQGLLSEQCGFRKNHSTLDHLVRFETFIRNVFVKKEHVLTIFCDLQKAYDTMWKSGGPQGSQFQGPPPQVYSELPVGTVFQG